MSRRVTNHNGRKGKNGVFNPKHNDRQFVSKDDHIDETKSAKNFYWTCIKDAQTFEECESEFYEKHFSAGLQKLNSKHSRHKDRMKTMDEYRMSARTCPEETLYYIGDRKQPIDEKLLQKILIEQINWECKKFPNVMPLDVALHRDEIGADHLHFRKVWIAHDDDGNEIVNQSKALQEMGIVRPDTDKKQDRYNNPKQTYTKLVRQHFIELCRSYGIEIEDKPKDKSKSGLSMDTYKAQQIKEEAMQEAETIKSEARSEAKRVVTDAQGQADRIRQEAEEIHKQAEEAEYTYREKLERLNDLWSECMPVLQQSHGNLRVVRVIDNKLQKDSNGKLMVKGIQTVVQEANAEREKIEKRKQSLYAKYSDITDDIDFQR